MSLQQSIVLSPLTMGQLHDIAVGNTLLIHGLTIADGAVPPPRVAMRALQQLKDGCAPEWVVPFHIVDLSIQTIVGGCTFKGLPANGSVEIGYGVAPSHQRRGYASAAVLQMLAIAAGSGQVDEVVALVADDNPASAGVVNRAGFSRGDTITDDEGEELVRWYRRCVV